MLLLLLSCVPSLYSDADPNLTPSDWSAPENTWSVAEVPASLDGEGCKRGDVLPEFRGIDQFGDEVSSWQFYGQCMLVDVGAGWCDPCQELASHTSHMSELYPEVVVLGVLIEDWEFEPAEPDDITEWVNYFDVDQPVVTDPEGWTSCLDTSLLPVPMVIGPDMRVIEPRIEPATPENVERVVGELCY